MAEAANGLNLTDAEIADICDPLVQPAAQVRALRRMGMEVKRKPSGRPLVTRAEYERAMGTRQASAAPMTAGQPNREGLVMLFNRKKANGSQAQK